MWNCFTCCDSYNKTATNLLKDMFTQVPSGLKDYLIATEASYQRVEELLNVGANPNAKFKDSRGRVHTLLTFAASTGNARLTSILLENGANPNAKDSRGFSCLSLALKPTEVNVAKDLNNGNTFADMVVENAKNNLFDRYNTVKHLLDAGANVKSLKNDKTAPVHQLMVNDMKDSINEQKLVDVVDKVNTDLSDISNASKKLTAVKSVYEEVYSKPFDMEERLRVLDLLVSKDFNINLTEKNGYTPLHYAVSKKDNELVDRLLDMGADVNASSYKGYSPLHIAVLNSDNSMVEKLAQKEANFDKRSKAGFTPFHIASYKGESEMLKLLIEKGANVDIKDKKGRDAIDFALMNNHMEVALFVKGVSKEKHGEIQKYKPLAMERPTFYNLAENLNRANKLEPALAKTIM